MGDVYARMTMNTVCTTPLWLAGALAATAISVNAGGLGMALEHIDASLWTHTAFGTTSGGAEDRPLHHHDPTRESDTLL